MKVKNLILVSLFAALVSILSIVRIPLPTPVPFTLQIFAVAITGGLLGSHMGAMALTIYTLIGAIGIPVFSGMTGGIHVLIGPTGGYIFGFIIASFVIGLGMEKVAYKQSNQFIKIISIFTIMLIGLIISYTLGTVQLKFVAGLTFKKAFLAGVAPFFILDIFKLIFSTIVVYLVEPLLIQSKLLPSKQNMSN